MGEEKGLLLGCIMPSSNIPNTNTYSVSEQKDKDRHGSSKQFGPKLQ